MLGALRRLRKSKTASATQLKTVECLSQKGWRVKSILAIVLMGILIGVPMSACTTSSGTSASVDPGGMTEDEKHRLYAAALAASEFPLENETFKEVCRQIGIFDALGNQNERYLAFVTAHIEWAMKADNQPFKREINSQEKSREYIDKFLR